MRYRSKLEILIAIVETASFKPGGVSKTRIMYSCFLSYSQTLDYLDLAVKSGLLVKTDSDDYAVTEKGLAFLRSARETKGYLQPEVPQ